MLYVLALKKIVLSIVQRLILAISVVHREWVNLAMVTSLHTSMDVSLPSDKWTYCRSLWVTRLRSVVSVCSPSSVLALRDLTLC